MLLLSRLVDAAAHLLQARIECVGCRCQRCRQWLAHVPECPIAERTGLSVPRNVRYHAASNTVTALPAHGKLVEPSLEKIVKSVTPCLRTLKYREAVHGKATA